jgi:hypothetical protein
VLVVEGEYVLGIAAFWQAEFEAVRGGGHAVAGHAVCDDGLMIDLSLMKAVQVDPAARTARAAGGLLWSDLDKATQPFGLATTLTSSTSSPTASSRSPPPFSQIGGWAVGGAVTRTDPDATAVGEREVGFEVNVTAAWAPGLRSGRCHRRHDASAMIASGRLPPGLRSGRWHRRHHVSAMIASGRLRPVPAAMCRPRRAPSGGPPPHRAPRLGRAATGRREPYDPGMAYDEVLAERVRDRLRDVVEVTEKKMFGGLAFLTHGNMTVGVHGDDLIARIDPARTDAALARPGVRPFDITGRPMRGWILVAGEALDDGALDSWVAEAGAFVATLPAK